MDNPFADARLLLDRAAKHEQEFAQTTERLWSYTGQRISKETFRYRVVRNADLLPRLKPIVADAANNLRSALNLLTAEATRLQSDGQESKNGRQPDFPFPKEDETLELSTKGIRKHIGDAYAKAIEAVWKAPVTYPYYLHVLRQVSNLSKHWQLREVDQSIMALQPHPGDRGPINLADDYFLHHDSFEWEGPKVEGFRSIVRLNFGDFEFRPPEIPMPPNPDTVLRTSFYYVRRVIEAFEAVYRKGNHGRCYGRQ